jgi:hypothetical protein
MKKIIFGAFVVAVGLGTVGCELFSGGGSNAEYTYTIEVPTKIEETEDGVTTTTEYAWNEDGSLAGQKQTQGGQLIYDDHDYTYQDNGMMTYYRTYYEGGLVKNVVRIEDRYLYTNWTARYSTRIYSGEGDAERLIERDEATYTDGTQTGYIHEREGVVLLQRTDYKYEYNTVTFTEFGTTVEGRQLVKYHYSSYENGMINEIVTSMAETPEVVLTRTKYSYTSYGYPNGYKVYKGDTEQVIEEQTDYKNEATKLSYVTKWYDDAGTLTRTLTTVRTIKQLTISVQY